MGSMSRPAQTTSNNSPSTALIKPGTRQVEPQPKTFPESRPAPLRFKEPSILADSPSNNYLPAIPNQGSKQHDTVSCDVCVCACVCLCARRGDRHGPSARSFSSACFELCTRISNIVNLYECCCLFQRFQNSQPTCSVVYSNMSLIFSRH